MGCLPYLKFYPGDWLSDRKVRDMTPEGRGLYFDLLCVAWQEGAIPDPPLELASYLRIPSKRFARIWDREVAGYWVHGPKGMLVNPRQEQERGKAETIYQQRVEAGRKGGRPTANGRPS